MEKSGMVADPYDLERFVAAQQRVYARVVAELAAGQKESHWMWFIFPQLAGLGSSPTAQRFAIRSRAEAIAYLAHPVLGPRLRECTELLLRLPEGRSILHILGYPDDLKFRSSMTLFSAISGEKLFADAIDRYYGRERDSVTLDLLSRLP